MTFLAASFGLLLGTAQAAEALVCPDGTADSEVTFADGTEVWCARPDGTRHGPYQKRDLTGRVIERGFWENGERSGHWRYYDLQGKVIRTGQMTEGRPEGAWTHFDPTGEPSATITHGAFPPADSAPPQPADPRYRWQATLDGTPTAWWPVGTDGVAVAIGTTRLVVLSLESGAITADIPLPAPLRPQLVVEGSRILGVTGPGELFVVDLDDLGGGTWQRVRTPVGVTDAIRTGPDGTVWVRSGQGRLIGLDLDSGDTTWSTKRFIDEVRPVSTDHLVVGVRDAREVRAVTGGTGAFAWQARMPAPIVGLATTSDQVLAVLRTGTVQALATQLGTPLWDLTLPLSAGVQPTIHTTADQLWVTTPHEAWRLDPVRGVVLDHHTAQAPDDDKAADFSVGARRSCTTGRKGAIRCFPGDWQVAAPPPALPALLTTNAVVVADQQGTITALDPSLARAIEQGTPIDAEVLLDEPLDAELFWDDEPIAIELPTVVVERPRPDADCSVTTAAVQLPVPGDFWAPEGSEDDAPPEADDAVLLIDDLVLYDDLGEGVFEVHPDWDETPAGTTWRMTWWHQHRPTLTALLATIDDTTDPAEVDALIRCEGPPARFAGVAQLEDGLRAFRLTGNLEVTPHPHSLDGVPGCLLDIFVSGTDHGAWSSPILPAWSEVTLEVHGDTLPDDLPVYVDVPEQLTGQVWIDAYEPWTLDRTEHLIDGTVDFRIDDTGDPRGPILRAFAGTRRVLEVPVPELTYGAVDIDDDGTVIPAPTIESHVHLARAVPFDTPDDSWRVLWTRSSCTDTVLPALPDDPVEVPPAAEPTDPPPEPLTRPQPMPPPKSRWRKNRTPKPEPVDTP